MAQVSPLSLCPTPRPKACPVGHSWSQLAVPPGSAPSPPHLVTSLCQRSLFPFPSRISRADRALLKTSLVPVRACAQKINTIPGTESLMNSFLESADYPHGGESMLMN